MATEAAIFLILQEEKELQVRMDGQIQRLKTGDRISERETAGLL
jgi:hypothetical protein